MIKKKRKKVGPGVKWPMGHATDDAVVPPLYIVKSHVIRLVYDRGQRLLILVRFSKNKNKSKNKTNKKNVLSRIFAGHHLQESFGSFLSLSHFV